MRKCLRELAQQKNSCTDLALVGQKKTEIEAAKFEEMEWKLVQDKVRSDVAALQVYRSKLQCHEALVYHARLEHKRRRRLQARDAVASLFTGPVAQFLYMDSVDGAVSQVLRFQKEHRLSQQPLVLMVVNWAAPSQVRDEHLALQMSALQAMINNDFMDVMGVLIMPVWERAKGNLFKSENLLLKSLCERDICTDEKASLSFQD